MVDMDYIKDLHRDAYVIDSHCDTPMVFNADFDPGKRSEYTHVDIDRMIEGGLDAVVWVVYTPSELHGADAINHSIGKLSRIYDIIDRNRTRIALARNAEEARRNKKKGLVSIFIGLENASPINGDIAILDFYQNFGISYITLCHSDNNDACDSSTSVAPKWGGLSPWGIELVREMNKRGIMVDVSHISDKSFYDVLQHSSKPVIASHSACRALCNVPRNMSDDMIRALAERNGVIQINFYPYFLDPSFDTKEYWSLSASLKKAAEDYFSDQKNIPYRNRYYELLHEMKNFKSVSYKKICDHIDHAVALVGPEHVGLGSDFDGIDITPSGLEDISKYPVITEELVRRGYDELAVRAILGENYLRVMSECTAL